MNETMTSYEKDFYAWAIYNANLMSQGKLSEIDVENIAEELESMGKSEQRELENRLIVLLAHLLKWHFQPDHRSGSWQGTINEQRKRIQKLLKANLSLKRHVEEKILEVYELVYTFDWRWTDTGITSQNY